MDRLGKAIILAAALYWGQQGLFWLLDSIAGKTQSLESAVRLSVQAAVITLVIILKKEDRHEP